MSQFLTRNMSKALLLSRFRHTREACAGLRAGTALRLSGIHDEWTQEVRLGCMTWPYHLTKKEGT